MTLQHTDPLLARLVPVIDALTAEGLHHQFPPPDAVRALLTDTAPLEADFDARLAVIDAATGAEPVTRLAAYVVLYRTRLAQLSARGVPTSAAAVALSDLLCRSDGTETGHTPARRRRRRGRHAERVS